MGSRNYSTMASSAYLSTPLISECRVQVVLFIYLGTTHFGLLQPISQICGRDNHAISGDSN